MCRQRHQSEPEAQIICPIIDLIAYLVESNAFKSCDCDDRNSLRVRNCYDPSCNALFMICARCDRGQRDCSETCRTPMRRLHQRAAGQRCQSSPGGREKHRQRQRAYRERQRPATVTHQGLVSIRIPSPYRANRRYEAMSAVCRVAGSIRLPAAGSDCPGTGDGRSGFSRPNVQISTVLDDRLQAEAQEPVTAGRHNGG